MGIKVLCLMLLLHIIDDFHLQGILKEMKQKSWWLKQNGYKPLYENDYKMALFIHSLSWSIMISLPVMLLMSGIPSWVIFYMILANTMLHYKIDDTKCNKMKISLMTDQLLHFLQIVLTWAVFEYCSILTYNSFELL